MVNFSLRYSPNNLAVASLANAGLLGEIHDIQVQTSHSWCAEFHGVPGRLHPLLFGA
jgi:predicted dehydrogenase